MATSPPSRKMELFGGILKLEDLPEGVALTPIEYLNLPARAYHVLKGRGVDRVGQLLQFPRGELAVTRGLGRKTLRAIQQALEAFRNRLLTNPGAIPARPENAVTTEASPPADSQKPAPRGWVVTYLDGRLAVDTRMPSGPPQPAPPAVRSTPRGDSVATDTRPRIHPPKRAPAGWLIPQPIGADLSAPVGRLGLSIGVQEGLLQRGIETVGELVDSPRLQLWAVEKFGAQVDAEIQAKLFDYLLGKEKAQPVNEKAATIDFVEGLLSSRPEEQQKLLRARYGLWDGKARTAQQVGQEMGLTKQRVREIQKSAMTRILLSCGLLVIRNFVTGKIAAYLERNAPRLCGVLSEVEAAQSLADGCSIGQASRALAFLLDLFPGEVSLLAQCLIEVEAGVYCIEERVSNDYRKVLAAVVARLEKHREPQPRQALLQALAPELEGVEGEMLPRVLAISRSLAFGPQGTIGLSRRLKTGSLYSPREEKP